MSFYMLNKDGSLLNFGPGSRLCYLFLNCPNTRPIRHPVHGLGWYAEFSGGGHATYFTDEPDILIQEMMAAEINQKRKDKKNEHKQ